MYSISVSFYAFVNNITGAFDNYSTHTVPCNILAETSYTLPIFYGIGGFLKEQT